MLEEYTTWIYHDEDHSEDCTTEGIEGKLRIPGEEIFLPRPKLHRRDVGYEIRNGPYILTSSHEHTILNLDQKNNEVIKKLFRVYEFHRCIYVEDFESLPDELRKLL